MFTYNKKGKWFYLCMPYYLRCVDQLPFLYETCDFSLSLFMEIHSLRKERVVLSMYPE